MPTQPYYASDGKRLPSVTTILKNLGWGTDALVAWAYNQGKEGLDRFQSSSDACNIGTMAHAMAEADIKGQPAPSFPEATLENLERAQLAYGAYLQWKRMTKIELVLSEIALVSETHRFGGCIDAVGTIESETVLVDFKTSNGIYAEHVIQVTAYSYLWNENHPETPIESVHILKFDKTTGAFGHHFYPFKSLNRHWQAFLNLKQLHDLKKVIGKAA